MRGGPHRGIRGRRSQELRLPYPQRKDRVQGPRLSPGLRDFQTRQLRRPQRPGDLRSRQTRDDGRPTDRPRPPDLDPVQQAAHQDLRTDLLETRFTGADGRNVTLWVLKTKKKILRGPKKKKEYTPYGGKKKKKKKKKKKTYWGKKKFSIFLVSFFLVFLLDVTPPSRGEKAYGAFRALDQEGYFFQTLLQGKERATRATRELTSDESAQSEVCKNPV